MPLSLARCKQCSQPLADPPHIPIGMACIACGRPCQLSFAADGQPADFNAAFGAQRLLRWFNAARRAMMTGTPGVAVGACPTCDWPLVVSSKTPISLPCPHCKHPVAGSAEDVLVDQWCEPWARVEGGGLSMEYRLAWVDDSTGVTAGCANCGTPSPADDPSMQCRRCGSTAWVTRKAPKASDDEPAKETRQQLGTRLDGTRNDRPYRGLLSIAQGEAALRSDMVTGGGASGAGTGTMSVLGLGCAIALALTLVAVLAIWIFATIK